jgi:acetyl esterase/lipase
MNREQLVHSETGIEKTKVVYKAVGPTQLHLHIFKPKEKLSKDMASAIIFFHGGGWRYGDPSQFYQHCKYFASRGMVAVSAEYRLVGKNASSLYDCVADSKSAVRWLRANAMALNIDPKRIAAGGGSAGGHLAACTAMIDGFEEDEEDWVISSKPNALVLFNPGLDLPQLDEQLSPAHHLKPDLPPMIIFHGTADRVVPHKRIEQFCEQMEELGNICELISFFGKGHKFFNYGMDKNKPYFETVFTTDLFLSNLGLLKGKPTLNYEEIIRQETKENPPVETTQQGR